MHAYMYTMGGRRSAISSPGVDITPQQSSQHLWLSHWGLAGDDGHAVMSLCVFAVNNQMPCPQVFTFLFICSLAVLRILYLTGCPWRADLQFSLGPDAEMKRRGLWSETDPGQVWQSSSSKLWGGKRRQVKEDQFLLQQSLMGGVRVRVCVCVGMCVLSLRHES